jgi:hypothetical protein
MAAENEENENERAKITYRRNENMYQIKKISKINEAEMKAYESYQRQ